MKSFRQMIKGRDLTEAMGGRRHLNFNGVDEIGDFWVVVDPSIMKAPELNDIFFKADVFDMILQEKGGLKGDQIKGLYKKESKAKKVAEQLLTAHKK